MTKKTTLKFIEGSVTPSTLLLNQMIGQLPANGMLTEVQIALLRKSAREISEKLLSHRTKKLDSI